MPWKLKPPREGKSPYYTVRGKYCGIRIDRSTGTSEGRAAKRIFEKWKRLAEEGKYSVQPPASEPSFVNAATAYLKADGDGTYLDPILVAWKARMLADIDQAAIDTLAFELYPLATPQTRNRQVHTPISAVLKHVGIEKKIRRPKGWRGKKSTSWLEPDQAFALLEGADREDLEFGLLCRFILYGGGLRLGEALSRRLEHLKLDRAFCYLEDSKNGEPRGVHLPPYLVQAFLDQPARRITPRLRGPRGVFLHGKPLEDEGIPFLDRDPKRKLFRFHNGGALRALLAGAMRRAGLSFPRRQGGFHLLCHTYGTWMHSYGGLDHYDLTDTGRWIDPASTARYVHTVASAAAKKADLLPTPKRGEVVEISERTG